MEWNECKEDGGVRAGAGGVGLVAILRGEVGEPLHSLEQSGFPDLS